MTAPADPDEPVITSREDAAQALAQRFLDNAITGQDADNDDIVEAHGKWKRRNG